MTLTLAEGLVDSVADFLAMKLSARLALLNSEYADGIELNDVVATYKGIKSLKSIPNYPILYVISPVDRVRPWQVQGTTAVIESKPEVVAGIVGVNADGEALQKQLYRYGRALAELMLEGMGTSNLNGWSLATDEEWEINTETDRFDTDSLQSSFIGEVSLAMRANRVENK